MSTDAYLNFAQSLLQTTFTSMILEAYFSCVVIEQTNGLIIKKLFLSIIHSELYHEVDCLHPDYGLAQTLLS